MAISCEINCEGRQRTEYFQEIILHWIFKAWIAEVCSKRTWRSIQNSLSNKKNYSVLRNISPKNLESLSFKSIINDCQLYAPLLLETLACVMNRPTENKLAVAVALLLRIRNTHMSAIHHVIGQILDHGGATDEVWILIEFNFITQFKKY